MCDVWTVRELNRTTYTCLIFSDPKVAHISTHRNNMYSPRRLRSDKAVPFSREEKPSGRTPYGILCFNRKACNLEDQMVY